MTVTLIDLGCGNTASVAFAFERLGASVLLTRDAHAIESAERVVLPGVSAAPAAMRAIGKLELAETIRRLIQPVLGICLGMQLMLQRSEEGACECLGIVEGDVSKLTRDAGPVPHMGWSRLQLSGPESPLLDGIDDGAWAYFAHSYACPPGSSSIAITRYGRAFSAALQWRNFFGCQFHPERSGETGARILQNFLRISC